MTLFHLLVALALLATITTATSAVARPKYAGQTAALKDGSNFCFFLPPSPGGDIAASEDVAVAFCTSQLAEAPGSKIFPQWFIRSAHFVAGPGYVQVTGKLNITAYKLSPKDQGGQYDVKAPVGAVCAGYMTFINLIEPAEGNYCIRCCNEDGCGRGR
ncbi:hypothetical protein BC938DRAFT_483195 [Jimgerdemannia flammicorona]|uniref:Uncharacterized protein n=1 Tax=Jimgerdemannia flammicorona TaxID=994334 RepID=A0A433QCJ3_9FUNG|nr:hypothetical protein BC938DRAFT_483195 [Jimgerdemannia flammicorona]